MNSARFRAKKVLPTPVGPRKINEPIGLLGSFKSALERRSAFEIAVTASSWPITCSLRSSSILNNLAASASSIRWSGTPVHFEMTAMMSSSSTSIVFSSL